MPCRTLDLSDRHKPDDQDDFDFEPESEEGVNDTPASVKKASKTIARKTTRKKMAPAIVSHCHVLENARLA
jgi:hypothetical protein